MYVLFARVGAADTLSRRARALRGTLDEVEEKVLEGNREVLKSHSCGVMLVDKGRG